MTAHLDRITLEAIEKMTAHLGDKGLIDDADYDRFAAMLEVWSEYFAFRGLLDMGEVQDAIEAFKLELELADDRLTLEKAEKNASAEYDMGVPFSYALKVIREHGHEYHSICGPRGTFIVALCVAFDRDGKRTKERKEFHPDCLGQYDLEAIEAWLGY